MDRLLFVRLLLIALPITVYWQVTGHGFIDFDDPGYVRDNPYVHGGLTGEGIKWAFTTNAEANWHPLTWLSLMLDAELYPGGAQNPRGYHLTNLVLHALNVLLLLEVLFSYTGQFWRSVCVAALFAVHPLHVESVAWISERKDVLSMLFFLLTLFCYVRYVMQGSIMWYALTAAALACGLMSKPMLVTLPFVLLLLDWWPLRRMSDASPQLVGAKTTVVRLLLEKIPFLIICAISACITMFVQVGSKQLEDGIWIPLGDRVANAAVSYVRYLGKTVWPVDLAVLYPNPSMIGRPFWSSWQVAVAAALVVAMTLLALAFCRRRPYFIVGWLWFLGTMVPVIGLVQIGRHSMADRYAYIPLIGLYIMIVWSIADVKFLSRWSAAALAVLVVGALAALTFRQAGHWSGSIALFEHTLNVTKDNWLIHNNLAEMYKREKRLEEAAGQLQRALAIYPECDWVHNHLGEVHFEDGRIYDAQTEFARAVELDPRYVKARINLGVTLQNRKQSEQAVEQFQKALELEPSSFEARHGLAVSLNDLGRASEAITVVEQGIQVDPAHEAQYRALLSALRKRSPR